MKVFNVLGNALGGIICAGLLLFMFLLLEDVLKYGL